MEKRGRVIVVLSFVTVAAWPLSAKAQLPPYQCGPDCTTPGQYVLCNDAFDRTMMSAGQVRLVDFLEAACASFQPPAASFNIVGFAALFGSGFGTALVIDMYDELGRATPGKALIDSGPGVQVPDTNGTGFSGLIFQTVTATGAFRLCLRQQIDDPSQTIMSRPVLYDADGMAASNTLFAPSQHGWITAASGGVTGDFILRPIVTYGDMGPWNPGGVCQTMDGGIHDSGPGADAAGGTDAMGGGQDAMMGGADAGIVVPGQDAGTAVNQPPMIANISPNQGLNSTPVDVVVTGSGFASGLTLKIGTISADDVRVPGPTTILAQVPANIAAGVYDVLVQNPDLETAILPKGYTVIAGKSPPASKCGCRTSGDGARASTAAGWMLIGALFALSRRLRPRS
jgi:MYXO-CTERM domain-containing protein